MAMHADNQAMHEALGDFMTLISTVIQRTTCSIHPPVGRKDTSHESSPPVTPVVVCTEKKPENQTSNKDNHSPSWMQKAPETIIAKQVTKCMEKTPVNQTSNEVVVIDSDSSSSSWMQNTPETKFAEKDTVCMKKEHENQTINEVVVIDSDSSSSFWLQNAPEAKFAGKVTVCTKKEHENQTVNEVVVVDSDSSSSSWMVKAPKTEFPEQFTGLKIPIPTWAVLSEQRVAVGCYIFAEDFPPEEVLFKNRGLSLKRKDLNTLLPGVWLVDDVLTAVAYYAAKMTPIINERPIWFLPGHLSYTMLLPGNVLTYEDVVKDNRYTSLMRNSFNPRKIYIPMNDSNLHWYLAVVLMDEGIIHLVDSKSTKTRTRERIKDVE
ncbi:hypothetical protein LINGRAHAP2_LOCUS34776, partial [Linum grandiflorum]